MCVCVYTHIHIGTYIIRIYTYIHVHTHTHTLHNFFIHSSTEEHSGCFHIFTIINNAAVNIGVQIFFEEQDSLSRSIPVIHSPKEPRGKKRVDSSSLKGLDHFMTGQAWDKGFSIIQ